jgi:hypothetical protein
MKDFVFTPDNLIDNLDRLGPWSTFALAEEAMLHYFPSLEFKDMVERISRMAAICCKYEMCWQDMVLLYHLDKGYKNFNPDYVNEH